MSYGKSRLVAVNELGCRVGEDHHRSKLTNAQVDEIRDLHEEHGVTATELAKRFGISRSGIRHILDYKTRAQTPAGWKRVSY